MINHVEIYIKDLNQELNFWEKINKILQLKILTQWDKGFNVGQNFSSYIFFNQTDNINTDFKRTNIGINHISLKTEMNKEEVLNALIKENINILYLDKDENNLFIENNWGLKIEIVF